MPSQKESNIDDFAFSYLETHYTALHNPKGILVSKAEETRQGTIADGIFAFKQKDNNLFIASLNTSQSKPLAELLTNFKKNGLGKFRFFTAFVIFAAAIALGRTFDHWALVWVAPVLLALTAFVIHSFVEKNRLKHKVDKLLSVLKAQPADEQWLGISISSLCFRNNMLAKHLLNLCERRGVGVITVGKRAKVIRMLEPKTATCRKGDFISHYISEDKIRKALLNGEAYLRVA